MGLLRRPLDDLKPAKVPTSAKVGKIVTGIVGIYLFWVTKRVVEAR